MVRELFSGVTVSVTISCPSTPTLYLQWYDANRVCIASGRGDPAGVNSPDLDPETAPGSVPVIEDCSLCPSCWYSSDRGHSRVSGKGLKKTAGGGGPEEELSSHSYQISTSHPHTHRRSPWNIQNVTARTQWHHHTCHPHFKLHARCASWNVNILLFVLFFFMFFFHLSALWVSKRGIKCLISTSRSVMLCLIWTNKS